MNKQMGGFQGPDPHEAPLTSAHSSSEPDSNQLLGRLGHMLWTLAAGSNRPLTSVSSDPLGTQAILNLGDRRESSDLEDVVLKVPCLHTGTSV